MPWHSCATTVAQALHGGGTVTITGRTPVTVRAQDGDNVLRQTNTLDNLSKRSGLLTGPLASFQLNRVLRQESRILLFVAYG